MTSSNPEVETAYERWEIGALSKDFKTKSEASSYKSKLHQEMMQSREEGYQAGLEEGRATGISEGLEIGSAKGYDQALIEGREQNILKSQQFTDLINNFEIELQQAKENTAQQILELCLEMSQAMLKTALDVRPELLLPIITQSLEDLPGVQFPATLHLNPSDIELVKLALGDDLKKDGWRIISDKHIEAGGCRLDTATNKIDATLPSRWQQLLDALGKTGEWLT